MRIGILGTGGVGQTIGTKLVQLGHDVMMGGRDKANAKAAAWVLAAGAKASQGTFEDAASFGELLFNCTSGMGTIAALQQAGEKNLNGKVLVDVANPLDFSKGMPPSLTICNTDSLGETIQRTFPGAKVVKSLNTVNANVMVTPSLVPGDHDVFVAGNDAGAKATVSGLLRAFGWTHVVDVGDIVAARGLEMYLPFWLRLWGAIGSPNFNIHIVKA